MGNKELKIKKVHLDSFINILVELYNRGVDYIDISAVNENPLQDGVGITFSKEYMNGEMMENFDRIQDSVEEVPGGDFPEEENDEEDDDKELTDDDLNQLI